MEKRFELLSVPGAERPWFIKDYITGKTCDFLYFDQARNALRQLRAAWGAK